MSQHVTAPALSPAARVLNRQRGLDRCARWTSALRIPFPLSFSISLTPAADSLPTSLAVSETGLVFSFATIKIGQDAAPLDITWHSHGIPLLK